MRGAAIFARTRGFYRGWQNLECRSAGSIVHRFNLCQGSRLFGWDFSGYAAFSTLPVPKDNLKRFLDHLGDAYTLNKKTEFEGLLQDHSIVNLLNERIKILENIKNLEELVDEDKEMKKLADEERITNENRLKEIDDELLTLIQENLQSSSFDDLILEITAGVGGQEAMIFVKDLLTMYMNHLEYLGYSHDIIELDESSAGGVRHASIIISGKGAFEKLRHEAGVHRVQRVPATEKSGRIHTSVVSVAILPQPSEIEVVINPKDLKIDTMRASGAGGQHVNTTNSAVRITHLPTGMIIECQTQRSQFKNKELAMAKLRARIYETKHSKQMSSMSSMRKQQMGMGERNEKIRTYNYNQDRVTDHRLSNGTLHNLKGFLNGGEALDNLHDKLQEDLQYKILLEALNNIP